MSVRSGAVSLAGQWEEIEAGLPADWDDARVRLTVEEAAQTTRAAALLGPLQPFRAGPDSVSIRVARDGSGPSAETARRALRRLDAERLHGTLSVVSVHARKVLTPRLPDTVVQASWKPLVAFGFGRNYSRIIERGDHLQSVVR